MTDVTRYLAAAATAGTWEIRETIRKVFVIF
jgi:uncharacterized cupin superfamily protein